VQLLALTPYGYFRDELYYLACSEHLAWGYVDHPPLSVVLLRVWRAGFGDSVASIRIVPALVEAAVVYLTVRTARALGASSAAAALAGFAVLAAPAFLAFAHFYSMNAIEHLVWALCARLAVQLAQRSDDRRAWLALGVVLGLGALDKWSVGWLAPGLAVGLALTPARAALRTPWPYAAVAIAGVLVAPHVLWQVRAGWPTLEFMHNALAEKYVPLSLGSFLAEVVRMANPVAAPLAVVGIAAPLAWWTGTGRGLVAARPLAVMFVGAFLIVASSKGGKPEYLLGGVPLIVASGAAAWDRLLVGRARGARRVAWGAAVLGLGTFGAVALPFGVPILSETSFVAYMGRLGERPSTSEKKELAELPQFYADMHGWPELTDAALLAWQTLSEDERRHAKIWAVSGGYGPAAAIDHFGPSRGLPHAISGHNTYWLWGYGDDTADVVILLGGSRERLETLFVRLDLVTTFDCRWCMPYENHKPIYVGRGMRHPWAEVWPNVKHYE
jgi:hypothetical protein